GEDAGRLRGRRGAGRPHRAHGARQVAHAGPEPRHPALFRRRDGGMTMARAKPRTRVVMLGTSFETHGGISSVVNAYRAAGLFARWPIEYVQTHCDGSRFAKWSCAIGAFFSMLFLALRHP